MKFAEFTHTDRQNPLLIDVHSIQAIEDIGNNEVIIYTLNHRFPVIGIIEEVLHKVEKANQRIATTYTSGFGNNIGYARGASDFDPKY